jgi:hypothetical protein
VIRRSTLASSPIVNYFSGSVDIAQSTLSETGDRAVITSKVGPGVPSQDNPTTSLQSAIVANPSGVPACSVPVISQGFNLAEDSSCSLTSPSDQPNTDPLLRPLGNYGGPTKTFALQSTSPAIDAGSASNTPTDQRGRPRIVDYPGVPKAGAVTTPTSGRSSCSRRDRQRGCSLTATSRRPLEAARLRA